MFSFHKSRYQTQFAKVKFQPESDLNRTNYSQSDEQNKKYIVNPTGPKSRLRSDSDKTMVPNLYQLKAFTFILHSIVSNIAYFDAW